MAKPAKMAALTTSQLIRRERGERKFYFLFFCFSSKRCDISLAWQSGRGIDDSRRKRKGGSKEEVAVGEWDKRETGWVALQ